MFVICTCPACKERFTTYIVVECLEDQTFATEEDARRYIIENIKVQTVLQHEEVLH
jgi:transcriptional regulator NrdR family protein